MGMIYHYTSGPALIGLITKGVFWATDITFLNDHAEHVHGYDASMAVINKLLGETPDEYVEELKEFYTRLLETVKLNTLGRDTYVVSFAKEKDSIAHWFSYCEKNQGYCIGFDEEEFFEDENRSSLGTNFACRFDDVIYGDHTLLEKKLSPHLGHKPLTKALVRAVQYSLRLAGRTSNILDEVYFNDQQITLIQDIYMELIFSSSSFKHAAFTHEVERRLTLAAKVGTYHESYKDQETGVQFRERNGVVFPYIPLNFCRKSIKEIVIGPSGDFDLRKRGLEKLLSKNNLSCDIYQSSTPLRFT